MRHVTIKADTAFTKGRIDDRIYGSFVEHMGRVVYTGIYEPSAIRLSTETIGRCRDSRNVRYASPSLTEERMIPSTR